MLNSSANRFHNLICMLVLLPALESVACLPAHGQIPPFAGEASSPVVNEVNGREADFSFPICCL